MRINLKRLVYSSTTTIGQLSVDGKKVCDTLEDVVRAPGAPKVWGRTAIPSGAYPVIVTWSPHFKRPLPLLVGVPNFEGVRIHAGNKAEDTEGCLLVGTYDKKTPNWISASREAFLTVQLLIDAAIARNESVIIVIEENHPGAA